VRAADRLDARFGEAEVLDLPFPNQILHGSRDVFDRNFQVDPGAASQVPQPR
jgi:hypothetical protein